MSKCTLVTAYYSIPSKFPHETYLQWATHFLQLDASIVLFTSPDLAETFRKMRGSKPLHIITKDFSELEAWKKYEAQWREHKKMDKEAYHTPELYALWAQKSFFMKEAIKSNPFYTPYFFWCDIGAFRKELYIKETLSRYLSSVYPKIKETFPQSRYLSSDRILFSSIEPLQPGDNTVQQEIPGNFTNKNRIVGGLWGGSIYACIIWHESYIKMLETYFRVSRFAGKDQSVMLSTYLRNPNLGLVVRPSIPIDDPWFFLTHLLSDLPVSYKLDRSYLQPPSAPMITTTLQGGLCNQIFQIVVAYAQSRRIKGVFRIRRNKLYEDHRPLYWDSFFHLFTPYSYNSLPELKTITDAEPTKYQQLPLQSCHLYGYFQSPKYFQEYSEEIRQLLAPPPTILQKIKDKYRFLLEKKDRLVVVHARRTDYCEKASFHGPLTIEYYQEAKKRLCVEKPFFLLCADDTKFWQDTKLFIENEHYLLENEDDVTTLHLLSQFFYFIIANSTFSWWGAWLAEAKQVMAPSRWFGPTGPKHYEDIYVPSWERI